MSGGLIRDDHLYTTRNPHVTEPVGIGTFLSSPLWPYEDIGLYRPLTTASFRIDYALGESLGEPVTAERAIVPHVHNLLLNAIGALLFATLLRRLGTRPRVALACALLFATHPARSEAFLWISGRAECLMTALSLGALVIIMGGTSWRRLCASGACASAAFLAKEQGATLLLLAPLLPGLLRRDRLRVLAVMAVAIVPWIGVRFGVLDTLGPSGVQQTMLGTGFVGILVHALGWFGRYVLLVAWPHPLLHEYDEPASADWLGIALTACALVVGIRAMRARGAVGFAAALFVLPLIPALNLVQRSSEPFAERFLALPLAGALAFIAAAFATRVRGRPLLRYAVVGLVLAASLRTGIRARDYADEATLFGAQMDVAQNDAASWGLWGELGSAAAEPGDVPARFAEAVDLAPHSYRWRIKYARALVARAGTDPAPDDPWLRKAADELTTVVERWPMIGPAWALLGNVELLRQRTGPAERALRLAVRREPRDWRSAWQLAQIVLASGRTQEARGIVTTLVAHLDESARRRPWDFQQLAAAGRVLLDSGQAPAAIMRLRQARHRALRVRDRQQIDALLRRAGG